MDEEQLATALAGIDQTISRTAIHTWHAKQTAFFSALATTIHADPRSREPERLSRAYAQVYSQYGEDGYIAELFRRIGEGARRFLEIGVGSGVENTTRFLLEQGWTGVWVEGGAELAREAEARFAAFVADGRLRIISAQVSSANINDVLDANGVEDSFDLISVDIDQNTGHVWRALNRRARACCIEYNASIPPSVAVQVPDDPARMWDGSNFFGAGLKVIELIGTAKGMALVGCDIQGLNAFLVDAGLAGGRFAAPFTAENHYELPRYSMVDRLGHAPAADARRWERAAEASQA